MYKFFFKRLFDFCIALISIICISPLILLIIMLLLFFNNGSGVFFCQKRPGKNAKIFKVIKFKTMNDRRDAKGVLLSDSERLTPIGKLVRQTSLDELPQLINVLKGDMSLIGPRPLLVEYLPLYNETQKHRHNIKPGITGWAQVNGRNAISWKKKFEYDVYYVENISLSLDAIILFKTVYCVFNKKGIYINSNIASMEAFNGKN